MCIGATTNWKSSTRAKGERFAAALQGIAETYPAAGLVAKGRGLARGLQFGDAKLAGHVCRAAFDRGLLMETSGPEGEVMKLLPPLTLTNAEIDEGLQIIGESVESVLRN